jgi:raffinose/stachyose/melibiose transport system permease protein
MTDAAIPTQDESGFVETPEGPRSRADRLLPYAFAGPAFLVYAALVMLPLGHTFFLSFFHWSGGGPMEFAGLANYLQIFTDPITLTAIVNNLIWAVLATIVPVSMALLLAVLLATHLPPGVRLFFTTVYYLPAVLALAVSAIVWGWVYNPAWGALNALLDLVGLGALEQPWLGDPGIALYAVFVVSTWAYFGFCLIILLAAIQNVDPSLYDAAELDGAGAWTKFWHVTVPGIRNELNFVVLYTVIEAFRVFDLIFIMTGGGPFYQTEVIATAVYREAFIENEVGYASAIASLMTLIIATLATVALRWRERTAPEAQ